MDTTRRLIYPHPLTVSMTRVGWNAKPRWQHPHLPVADDGLCTYCGRKTDGTYHTD